MTKDMGVSITLFLMAAAAILAIVLYPGFAQSKISDDTENFVKQAGLSSLFEIRSSEIALQRAQRADVKSFAQKMIEDHTKLNQELKTAISTDALAIEPPTALDSKHQEKVSNLGSVDAEDFDDEYIDAQIEGHKKAIELFEDYAENGDSPELRKLAARSLSDLNAHHNMVEDLEEAEDPR